MMIYTVDTFFCKVLIGRLVLKSNHIGKVAVDQCMKKYTFYIVCAEKF
jgi:hypothetical protein